MNIFFQLVRADLRVFRRNMWSETIDLLIWVGVVMTVTAYIMPIFGVPMDFIYINFAGIIASSISFRTFPSIFELVGDFHGEKTIAQKLILPIAPWVVFVAIIVSFFLRSLIVCIWALPLGALVMWKLFPMGELSLWRFAIVLVTAGLFFSSLSLLLASFVPSPDKVGRVWLRFLFPLWFFGGFQFTWYKLYENAPILALIDLFNPYIYNMEGMRVALLGPSGNLPLWVSSLMLVIFAVGSTGWAIRRLKRQLDFVTTG